MESVELYRSINDDLKFLSVIYKEDMFEFIDKDLSNLKGDTEKVGNMYVLQSGEVVEYFYKELGSLQSI